MSLPTTFNDLIDPMGDVLLESTKNGEITAPTDVVIAWLAEQNPTVKVAEYIAKWKSENRIK